MRLLRFNVISVISCRVAGATSGLTPKQPTLPVPILKAGFWNRLVPQDLADEAACIVGSDRH